MLYWMDIDHVHMAGYDRVNMNPHLELRSDPTL
jgi:hypothetical protein